MHTYVITQGTVRAAGNYITFFSFLFVDHGDSYSYVRVADHTKMTFAPARNAPSLARRRVELSLMATVDKAEVCLSRADHLLFKAQFTAHHHICIFLQ